MSKALVILALLVALALSGCGLVSVLGLNHVFESDLERSIRLADMAATQAREQQQAEEVSAWFTAATKVVVVVVPSLIIIGLLVAGSMWVDNYIAHKPHARLVYVDEATGTYPASIEQLASPLGAQLLMGGLQGYHAAQIAGAANTGVPAHYSIHTVNSPHPSAMLSAAVAPPPPVVADVAAPSFSDLLTQGVIGPGRPMVLGWAGGQPILGTRDQLYSAAIAGRAGSGKSCLAALIIGQSALAGDKLLIVDPHRHKADSLARKIQPLQNAFLMPIAGDPKELAAVVAYGERLLEERRAGADPYPALLVIDEYTLIMRREDDLARRTAKLVEAVATEGRGMGFNALLLGQNWKAERSGSTNVRDVLTACYALRSWAKQARYLVPDSDLAAQAESLTPGRAIFAPTDGEPQVVSIPYTTADDMVRVGQLLPATNGYNPGYNAPTSGYNGTGDTRAIVANSYPIVANVADLGEGKRAYEMFCQGRDIAEIVAALRTVTDRATGQEVALTSSRGASYQMAAREIQQLIRNEVNGGGGDA